MCVKIFEVEEYYVFLAKNAKLSPQIVYTLYCDR